jgi:hypothetical protein
VSEQLLCLAHVGLLLDQVGERSSQRVRVGVDAGSLGDPAHEAPDGLT